MEQLPLWYKKGEGEKKKKKKKRKRKEGGAKWRFVSGADPGPPEYH